MKRLVDQLAQYASYHRDHRNIQTHLLGIPMIVLSVSILLSRPAVVIGGAHVSPAMLAGLAASLYYLRLDLRMGLVMSALLSLAVWAGGLTSAWPPLAWLGAGAGLFVVGWIIQFVGHHFEGRKPAFVDDLIGLIIGPLFVVAEVAFMMGWRKDVEDAIAAKAGGVR